MTPKFKFNNFYQIIDAYASKNPNRIAVFENETKITYQELKLYADKLANFLLAQKVTVGDKVGIVMSNSWEFIASVFAISKIGAIVVPINNFLKEEELAYILNNSHSKFLFSSYKFYKETQNLISKTDIKGICWVDGCPIHSSEHFNFNDIMDAPYVENTQSYYNASIEELAIIIYTSGTTGKPKGAMLRFRNIFSNVEGAQHLMGVRDKKSQMLCYLPMFHAFTFTVTIITPLYLNSSVIVIKSISTRKDFKNLLTQVLIKRVKFFTGVPDVYSAMAKAKLPWYFHWFHAVKGFISGAAPLSEEVYNRFKKSFNQGILEGYGISECSPVISCNSVKENRFGSVGKPLKGYQVKILDENLKEVPQGDTGEICVKGDCVMLGYYNNEEATKEAIVDGWFRTGDVGRIDKDGYIFIVDRIKDLIIHKGMNIYPREIEEHIYKLPQVLLVAVIGEKDIESNETPVAYIELVEGEKLTETAVKEHLRGLLAPFKQPKKIIFMDKLPKNATGKILKREIREIHHKTLGVK